MLKLLSSNCDCNPRKDTDVFEHNFVGDIFPAKYPLTSENKFWLKEKEVEIHSAVSSVSDLVKYRNWRSHCYIEIK